MPTATLKPGAFYGRRLTLNGSAMNNPGKYTIGCQYTNGDDLKDKGFNCWTGEVQCNTAVFDGPPVWAPTAPIWLLVKAKPQYRAGEPVMIEVRLYNSGDKEKEVYVPDDELLRYYTSGTDYEDPPELGKADMPKAINWKPRVYKAAPKFTKEKLQPGRAFIKEYDLREVCDLAPGKYVLRLKSHIPDLGDMSSNLVYFEIIPAEKPVKPAPPQEKPGVPVNGLLAEVKVLNDPIYPGDDIETIFRLTNVQKEGDIQIIDFPILGITVNPTCVGPDGKQIAWPMPMMMPRPPDAPTATIKPGAFYERKITLSAADLKKPGKYSLSFRYSNGETIADKGFKCWTGNLETNTVVFEVADVDAPAVNGIKMFVKMKPKYVEGEPVMIEVRLYNAGAKEKELYRPVAELLIARSSGQVKDEKGNVLEWMTALVEALPPEEVKLAPGRATTREYDLRGVCALPVGKYTFQLHSSVPTKGGPDAAMTSNEVSFEIVAPEKPKTTVKGSEGITVDCFHMTVNMAKEKYAEKEPVKFTYSTKNVSDKEQKVYVSKESLRDFVAGSVVKNAEGKTMPWKIKPDGTRSEYDIVKLQPGEMFTNEYDLLEACDLPAGKYTLTMRGLRPGVPDMEVQFEIVAPEKPKP
jgi:hypothetical protein